MSSWQTKCRQRLQEYADRCFHQWAESKAGRKWTASQRAGTRRSPYRCGFSLPDFHHDLIAALGRNDEREAKAIMLQHYLEPRHGS